MNLLKMPGCLKCLALWPKQHLVLIKQSKRRFNRCKLAKVQIFVF